MAAGVSTGGASGRAGFGWVILVAALAIPGVLFYNWWSHLKAEREKSVAAKARGRVPDGGVFQTPPPSTKLVNPMDAAATPAPSTSSVSAAVGAPPALTPNAAAATPAPASAPAPGGNSSAQDAAILAASGGVAAAAPAAAPAVSTVPVIAPLKRDPMISPLDQVRMMEEEEAKRLAKERLEQERLHRSKPRVAPKIDPSKFVELQGIISTPEGESKAIVNNDIVSVGQSIGHGIKVVRITNAGVVFEHQGKRFTKSVNQ